MLKLLKLSKLPKQLEQVRGKSDEHLPACLLSVRNSSGRAANPHCLIRKQFNVAQGDQLPDLSSEKEIHCPGQ